MVIFILSLALQSHWGQFYLKDPTGNNTPILPRYAQPRIAGGWLIPPSPPSAKFIQRQLAQTARTPGDVIISHVLHEQKISKERFFPGMGPARVWSLTYECIVIGLDGPYAIYTDRVAVVLAR
jgi:hypothetical protein